MIDLHQVPYPNWGVNPVLFSLGDFPVQSYSFFVLLGLIVGIILFISAARKDKSSRGKNFYLVLAAIIGGTLGAKIPIWIINFNKILATLPDLTYVLSGRTIVGGLIGGTIAVIIVKKKLGIKTRRGNLFAAPAAIGIAIGRIGCFLRGCCYGKPTSLPWGVDFGDNLLRHPTQIYEIIFLIGLFIYIKYKEKRNPQPGQLFDIFMISYFTFRFLIEFIRVEPVLFLGLTGFQYASLLVLAYYLGIKPRMKN